MSNSMSSFWRKLLLPLTTGIVLQLLSQTLTMKNTEGKAEMESFYSCSQKVEEAPIRQQLKVSVCVHAHIAQECLFVEKLKKVAD